MWGNHLLDAYQHVNFNVSFPHDLTRNPSRLIQWQYWWWFWFSSIFVLYYFILTRNLLKRSLKFRPKIVTSYRAHGRWGDIIVAVIPVFWCFNILSHSTLLLRMSEFQTETNILTIRVRGRQWYWIYKLELSNFFTLSNKKTLFSGKKQVNLQSHIMGGKISIFTTHNNYRQYWRNWFLNKNTFFSSRNFINPEMVTPETNLNDTDLKLKSKQWKSHLNRVKFSWYNRGLDSNTTNVVFKNKLQTNKIDFLFTDSFTLNKNQRKNLESLNQFNFFQKFKNSNKATNNLDFITTSNYINQLALKKKNSFLFQNDYYLYTISSKKNLVGVNGYLQFKNGLKTKINTLDYIHNHMSINYFLKNFNNSLFLKSLVELYKSDSNVYANNKLNLFNSITSSKKFKNLKEPVRYTFDLKPKFGYLLYKINLVSSNLHNSSLCEGLKILTLQPESEYEMKEISTIVRYFMVLDQNRRILNRSFGKVKIAYLNRLDKINNLYDKNINIRETGFKYSVFKKIFDPIKTYDKDGNEKTLPGNDRTAVTNLIKSKKGFINTSSTEFKNNSDFDYFSPVKYNINSELSNTQTNVRSKKKLLYNQRLLHTTSVLVLPTKLNITVITNSYDVIHSWFIPGLGLKMDCVPGRSTHHTLFIDHPGIYYGQCAEICGRFHHHMPIKIAALQWEHFLLWWYHHTMNLSVHSFLKDLNRTSLKEFKTHKVYPVTSKFLTQKPIV